MLSFPLSYPSGLGELASMEEECARRIKSIALARLMGRKALIVCAKALPNSHLGRNVALETIVPMSVEGLGTYDAVLRFVPIDLFAHTDGLPIDLSGIENKLVKVRVKAALDVDLWSRGGGLLGAPHGSVATEGAWQEFLVPKGEYFASPHVLNLLGPEYGATVNVVNDGLSFDMTDKSVPAWLTLSVVDATGRPTDQYSAALSNSVSNALVHGALFGSSVRIATAAGDLQLRVFDRAGSAIEEATIKVVDGSDVLQPITMRMQ
jgi:hypothetical protein